MRLWCLFLACLIVVAPAADDDTVDELGFSRAPYVQLATSSGVHVLWRTVDPMKPKVRFGTSLKGLYSEVKADQIRLRLVAGSEKELKKAPDLLHSGPKRTRQFEAPLTDLKPDTRYYYAIYDGGKRLTPEDESYHFQTLPVAGKAKDAYFWVVGDSGTGSKRQSEVHEAMLDYTESLNRPIDFYLHVGDMAYSKGRDDQFQSKFFDMYKSTLRHTVVWPALGNHEGASASGMSGVGPYFDAYLCPTQGEAGGAASGNESYYAFDYGRIHFIVLNSFDVDRGGDGEMVAWLKEDLARVKADWLVAYWHHPPYSKGTHDSDNEKDSIEMRQNILPILESHGVDLVLTGHSHIYERSMLMDGAYSETTTVEGVILDDGDGDPAGDGAYRKVPGLESNQGTIQIVAGHGGAGVGRKGTMPVMKRVMVENGSVLVSIKGNVLDAVMINFDGVERDHFQLRKEPGVVVERVKDPLVLPPYVPPGGELPSQLIEIIPRNDEWAYFLAKSDPPKDWADAGFDDSSWLRGKAGFGYGDDDDETLLASLIENNDRLYVRHAFTLPKDADRGNLGIGIRYDDAFIVYVNGHEVRRQGIEKGRGAKAKEVADHEAEEGFEYFSLRDAKDHLKEGVNVIAIEAHSIDSDEGDFTLSPFLVEKLDAETVGGEAPPLVSTTYVPLGELWRYSLEQKFEDGWEKPEFDDRKWPEGRTPMGYGGRLPIATSLRKMKDAFTRVRFRREIDISDEKDMDSLGLLVGWDDGFIAYVNGHEIGRGGVARGTGENAIGFGKTSRPMMRYFPLSKVKEHLKKGRNLIGRIHSPSAQMKQGRVDEGTRPKACPPRPSSNRV
ncbi:MAG: hypothetical protein ACI957_002195, partial [Verrucomicrobiales bacterium]